MEELPCGLTASYDDVGDLKPLDQPSEVCNGHCLSNYTACTPLVGKIPCDKGTEELPGGLAASSGDVGASSAQFGLAKAPRVVQPQFRLVPPQLLLLLDYTLVHLLQCRRRYFVDVRPTRLLNMFLMVSGGGIKE
jgi:hypothetical protein